MESAATRCQLCGKSIAVMAWVVERQGQELIFCEADCERLYDDYWLPKYASKEDKSV